jgi:hypothetical protein
LQEDRTFMWHSQTGDPGSEILIRRVGHRILSNRLVNGSCPDCKRSIPGVWS